MASTGCRVPKSIASGFMRAGSLSADPEPDSRLLIALTFALAVGVRAAFAIAFPTLHGGDATARLANPGTLVLGYQLPLAQVFVSIGKAVSDDPVWVRLLFCLWGGILASGLTALLAHTVGRRAALFGALLASTDPLLIHYSIVPYQEPLAYGLLLWALWAFATGRDAAAGILLGAASVSRYEPWLFLPWFFFATRSWAARIMAAAPITVWILWWRGLAPAGLYVLDLDTESSRVTRVLYLLGKISEYEGAPLLLLAGLGLALSWPLEGRRIPMAVLGLVVVMAVVIGAGHEYPVGSGLMSERLIHMPVVALLFLAAAALGLTTSRWPRATWAALAIALLLAGRNLRFETSLLRAAARDPDLALARDTAREIERFRAAGECVAVIAPPIDPTMLAAYVAKVEQSFGDVPRARERAAALAMASPDRDRIAAHLKAPTGTVQASGECPLRVFIDTAAPLEPNPGQLLAEISAGSRKARIYRTPR